MRKNKETRTKKSWHIFLARKRSLYFLYCLHSDHRNESVYTTKKRFWVIYDDFVIAKLSLLWFFGGFEFWVGRSKPWKIPRSLGQHQKMEICWQGQFGEKTRDFPWLIMLSLNPLKMRRSRRFPDSQLPRFLCKNKLQWF